MTEIFVLMVAVTTGITEVIKRLGISKRFVPLVSLVIGVGACAVFVGMTPDVLLQGVIVGLTASGLYSSTKATLDK